MNISQVCQGQAPTKGTWSKFDEYVYNTKLDEAINGGMTEEQAHTFVSGEMADVHLPLFIQTIVVLKLIQFLIGQMHLQIAFSQFLIILLLKELLLVTYHVYNDKSSGLDNDYRVTGETAKTLEDAKLIN